MQLHCSTFLLAYYFLTFYLSNAAAQEKPATNKIHEAIDICREKLKVDPHLTKVQHSLAQLLDSQISYEQPDESMVNEVINLYYAVGLPPPDVTGKRLPPANIRFESLVRAATIANDILFDSKKTISLYTLALELDGLDEKSMIAVFEMVMPLLLSSVIEDRDVTISPDSSINYSSNQQSLQNALHLCNKVSVRCPNEPVVDEYTGATLRKMKNSQNAYQSYHQAMAKSKQLYLTCKASSNDNNECIAFLTNYVKTCILVSAAGREVGVDSKEQMRWLTEAEAHALPFLKNDLGEDDIDQSVLESTRNVIVDLYNNMGIVEKKRGGKRALKSARTFFLKALEVKHNDGHALVQLASIEGDKEDEVVANSKKLDAEYVSALFDGYSSRFESELVDVLEYKGHYLVYDSLQASWKGFRKSPSTIQRIVDLGCGTGLLGELVANDMPWVELHGVDISQRMTDISRQRKSKSGNNVYTTVENGDAAEYLASMESKPVDCVLASDVFIYIGDISRILEESSMCLVENGLVGFTIERYENPKQKSESPGLKLLQSGRFGHSKAYIHNLASANGFEVSTWKDCTLRKQGGTDVKGAVVILKKS